MNKTFSLLAVGAAVAVLWTLLLVCDREVVEQARHPQNLNHQAAA